MLLLILLIVLLPFCSNAQINRSATELAKERVTEYITTKIFKSSGYEPLNYGSLKPTNGESPKYNWMFSHQFAIADTQFVADKRTVVKTPYIFSFYLDKKLKVVSADGYHRE